MENISTNEKITKECNNWAHGQPLEDILWYLQEHYNDLDNWAECFKKSFCEMVDGIKKELQEEEEEEE